MGHTQELILYRDLEPGDIFKGFTQIMEEYEEKGYRNDMAANAYEYVHKLVEFSEIHGFGGNLWHTYLAFLIVNSENAYSIACEMREAPAGSIHTLALHDFKILKALFEFGPSRLEVSLQMDILADLLHYKRAGESSNVLHKEIRDQIINLSRKLEKAKSPEAFQKAAAEFYKRHGVGKFGLHKAFRLEAEAEIVPIRNIAYVTLDDLIGYETAKRKLSENTEAFINGKAANNCLLYGDAGTGKSTSIKAIVNQYYGQGLRIIELYKHQFQNLYSVITQIKNRNYKFIIYMDDLSFEDFETEYKYLKAVIEGGLEKKPENVLIYATSNRRHLIREKFSDKEDRRDDLHTSETVQEKLSLAARFGVTVYFGAPTPREFKDIVKELAKRNHVQMEEGELLKEANKWELSHGGLSGRTAQQFINYLLKGEAHHT